MNGGTPTEMVGVRPSYSWDETVSISRICVAFSPDRMRGYRVARGLTRDALAHVVGTTGAVIKNYETGLTLPDPDTTDRLAVALDVASDRLAALHTDGLADLADALIEDRALDPDGVRLAADLLRRLGYVAAFRRAAHVGTAA